MKTVWVAVHQYGSSINDGCQVEVFKSKKSAQAWKRRLKKETPGGLFLIEEHSVRESGQ